MKYTKQKHLQRFYKAIEGKSQNNDALMSAIYLLTVDTIVWKQVCSQVNVNSISFDKITLKKTGKYGYCLFCAARDMYLGTKYLSVSYMTDKDVIQLMIFRIICNSMAIRRFGLLAIECEKNRKERFYI